MNQNTLLHESFLPYSKKKFDTILIETDFVWESVDFLWAIAHHTRISQKLLIIPSTTPIDSIFPFIQKGEAITTLINTHSGISSFSVTWFWDLWDIAKARDFWLQVYEAIYQEQLENIIEKEKQSCYIRLNEATTIKEQIPSFDDYTDIISFQKQDNTSSKWTLLCFWTNLINTLYAVWFLQEEGHTVDIFSTHFLFFTIHDELKKSLQKTEHLFIIIDQHMWSLYESWIQTNLHKSGLSSCKITFITPYYQQISSIAMEYSYEQAEFDWFHIAKRIKG